MIINGQHKRIRELLCILFFLFISGTLIAQEQEVQSTEATDTNTAGVEASVEDGALPEPEIVTTRGDTERVFADEGYPIRDFTPEGYVRQPSYVHNAGSLNKGEHAFYLYSDATLAPLPVFFGYQFGVLSWWDVGFEVGGNYGLIQVLLDTKMEVLKTRETEFFYWGTRFKTGFKRHQIRLDFLRDPLPFDDVSWLLSVENTFAFRLGPRRRQALYLNAQFYADFDLRRDLDLDPDLYIGPAFGFETAIGRFASLFIETGAQYSITGMHVSSDYYRINGEDPYQNEWFPTLKFGVAVRTGERTAVYITQPTKTYGFFPYTYEHQEQVLIEGVDIDQTLQIAEFELAEGGIDSVLTVWVIRNQIVTPEQAKRMSELYFKYIDTLESAFGVWHFAWAIADLYRLGDTAVREELVHAYKDARMRPDKMEKLGGLTRRFVNDKYIYMGNIHFGGKAYAKTHIVVPGNENYVQSYEAFMKEKNE